MFFSILHTSPCISHLVNMSVSVYFMQKEHQMMCEMPPFYVNGHRLWAWKPALIRKHHMQSCIWLEFRLCGDSWQKESRAALTLLCTTVLWLSVSLVGSDLLLICSTLVGFRLNYGSKQKNVAERFEASVISCGQQLLSTHCWAWTSYSFGALTGCNAFHAGEIIQLQLF